MSSKDWHNVNLGKIITLNYGKALPEKNRKCGSVPVYSSAGHTGWHQEALVNDSGVIVGRKGTVGKVYYSPSPFFCIDTAYYFSRSDTEQDLKFLYYLLQYLPLTKLNTDSAVPGLNRDNAYSQKIALPTIQEQKAIAHVLSTLDDKIEVNNRINKTLEDMSQAIFKRWFVDFEFPNEEGEPYKSSGGEMVESELGMIPKGWEVKKVEQVTKIIRGASPRPIQDFIRDEGIPWVKISDASSSNTRFISSTKEFIKEEGRKKSREVKVGTLILSNSATPGIPMIMKIDACVHDGWLIFDEFREVTKEYMFHFLTENRIGILSLSNGSVFRNLKTDILKNYKIIIPSRDVVARVDNIFKSINNSIDNIENQITTLTKIRDGLLTKLMSGEIRVPLDEEGDVS